MGVLDFIRGRDDARLRSAAAEPGSAEPKQYESGVAPDHSASDSDTLSLEARNEKDIQEHPNEVTKDAYSGVQKAEAAALVWSRKALYMTYAWIWVAYFMLALQQSIGLNVQYYAYSSFQSAPEISTANILGTIIGGVLTLPIAKILNLWGRAEGFLIFIVVYLVGIVILASCNGPDSYAAGYVLFVIGYDAIYLILNVFVADTSGLRNRAFAFAFVSTPFICTAFTGPRAAESWIRMTTWRWAYGAFAIIMPVVFAPLLVIFKYYQRKAEKLGLYKRERSGRSALQSIRHYILEFDIIGAFLLMAAFVLFLLPFSLVSNNRAQYKSATFIAMVIIGVLLFPVFAIWERFFARTHFVRWELFKNRTVLGACVLAAVTWFSFYCWDLYFFYFCMVVYNLTQSEGGYMQQIYNIGSCFWGVVFGVWVRYTKRFKYTCLLFGLPLLVLGGGLMIHFRGQGNDIGYIIMCQIFIAFGGGTLVIGRDMAVMAAADRDGVPMMLSLLTLTANFGGAIGSAVSTSIYGATFEKALLERLPESARQNATQIVAGGYTTQMQYPVGSPERDAINYAWGESQKYGAIAATAILALAFPGIAVWKNYRVDKQQNKGLVL